MVFWFKNINLAKQCARVMLFEDVSLRLDLQLQFLKTYTNHFTFILSKSKTPSLIGWLALTTVS